MSTLGRQLREARKGLGMTLDEVAKRTGISKPYLSLIETDSVANPPSDDKLSRLEQCLGFSGGSLVFQAHLMRTPPDVREMLSQLLADREAAGGGTALEIPAKLPRKDPKGKKAGKGDGQPVDLDAVYMTGQLADLVQARVANTEPVTSNAVPVINKVAAGYPSDFTDMGYPQGAADAFIAGPDVGDADAFAARVVGDSMQPKYTEGDIVIFSPALVPRNGDDVFVRFEGGETTFKRVFFEANEEGVDIVRLQPRNEKYRPQVHTPDAISGMYRAVYRYQKVDEDFG